MAVQPLKQPQIIYLVERLPAPPQHNSTLIYKIKYAAGIALALLGLAIVFGSGVALAGYFAGSLAITAEVIHPFFMTGIACAISGFHLAKGGDATPSAEISAGPLAVTI